ncbi:DUF1501 domain-containing protein [Tundrisphaera lichenicola]|uniref:DUF1501 domain-containing protein n=1 Tax=Tundrisphaera lichenicola TaxID=2029860 RepID=UPI003EBFD3A8
MLDFDEIARGSTRRQFLGRSTSGIGVMALASLLNRDLFAGTTDGRQSLGALPELHFAPKAKRVIYLFMSGGPSQIDLFDPKPVLKQRTNEELPDSVRNGQRITGMTSGQSQLLMVGASHPFKTYGQNNVELSELIPHLGEIVDDVAIIRSMHTDPINHDPAVTFLLTGNQQPGRPTLGSWVSYGLGSENQNLPEYVILLSGGGGQPLLSRYWGNGFLPSKYQGVSLRSTGDPVLYVSNPEGIDPTVRRQLLDGVQELNKIRLDTVGDPEIAARINSYEMAYRMQTSVPELMDIAKEPKEVVEMYGATPGQASFANNCLLARRLVERDVRFVQLYHRDWDHHSNLPVELKRQCDATDKPAAALVKDLKRLGLLDETLVIWGGEFGRTTYSQGKITADSFGRDHHPRCFTMWMAGGGIKGGQVIGKTDDFAYNIVEEPVHAHDLQATVLRCLGVDHTRLTFRSQGRDFRLTDVSGKVVEKLLA